MQKITFLLLGLLILTLGFSATTFADATVTLEQPVHFTTAEGVMWY
ncbi:MAG: hypothetical protein WD425_21310 [Nitrospirales bacterium]